MTVNLYRRTPVHHTNLQLEPVHTPQEIQLQQVHVPGYTSTKCLFYHVGNRFTLFPAAGISSQLGLTSPLAHCTQIWAATGACWHALSAFQVATSWFFIEVSLIAFLRAIGRAGPWKPRTVFFMLSPLCSESVSEVLQKPSKGYGTTAGALQVAVFVAGTHSFFVCTCA